jgi:hypothetical protein
MNRSVNVSQGLKKFFFYLFLSGCLGLFGNQYIQKKLQQFWGPIALQLRDSGVELTSPRMVFSRHGFPVLGARIDKVRYEKSEKCFNGAVTIENVFVPFSVFQLLSQKLSIGEVEVENLRFQFTESAGCFQKGSIAEEQDLAQVAQKVVEKTIERTNTPEWFSLLDRWFLEGDKILAKNPVSSLAIRALSLDARTLEGKALTAQGNAYVNFKKGVSADVHLNSLVLQKAERSLSTDFVAEIHANDESIQVVGDWAFHGGHFSTELGYNKNQNFKMSLISRDLPVGVVNRWLGTPWSFQFLWFNCQLQLEGNKADWEQTPWLVKSCRMDGPSGDITLADETLTSLKTPKKVSFKITKLDLDKIIHGRETLPLTGIFKSFGQLEGRVDLFDKKWQARLNLLNSQAVFSSENIRKLQTIDEIDFSGGYDAGIYSLKVLSANIRNGEFEGSVSVDYDVHSKVGQGQVAVQKLSFDDSIEELMFAGHLSPLEATGKFTVNDKVKIEEASLLLNLTEFKGANIDVSAIKVDARWSGNSLATQLSASQIKILKKGTGRWIIGSLLNRADAIGTDSLMLTQAQARGIVSSPLQIKMTSFTAHTQLKSGPLRLEAAGVYDDESMEGTWRWLEKEKPVFYWKWRGNTKQILLIPQSVPMKDWLRENSDFLQENAYISLDEK